MKKKLLFLFTLMLSSCFLQSQVFNNRYIIDQTAMVFQRLVQTGDTIITMGLGSTFYAPYPSKLMFTKFDQEGEVLNYDVIIGDSLIHYYPLSSSSQGRKILAVGGAGGSLTNESGFYALYDLDNGLEWIKQYYPPDDWIFFLVSCLFLEDKIYLFGNQQDPDNGYIVSTKLICTDLQGDILWEKTIENNNFDFVAGAITLNQDSNIYIGLAKSNVPFIQGSSTRSLIYELDLEGNIISEWVNDETSTYEPEQIIEVGDSSLLYVGRYLTGINADNVPLWQGYICKVDSLNNRDWTLKTGKPTFLADMNNLIATMDGNYIAIGVTFDSLSSTQVATESGHIIKFNIEGEIIWERRHYGVVSIAGHNKLYDIVELADSSLLLCGQSIDGLADFPQQGWLLKLDKYGSPDTIVSITSPPSSTFENNMMIFPNPANDQIEIRINEENTSINQIEIFDTSGRLVDSRQFHGINSNTLNFNISHLDAGIYIVKINDKFLKKIYVY